MPRRDALSLPDVLFALVAVAGAVVGSVYGFNRFGVLGAVVGVPAGFVAGGAATVVLCIVLAAGVFGIVVAWAFLKGGRAGVRELFRETPPERATDSTTAGE